MADWAIVIGIDAAAYEGGGGSCVAVAEAAAAAEAAAMADWLAQPDGGGVPPRNVVRRLGVAGDAPGASYDLVATAFHDVVDRAGGSGDRLTVVFAGRALQTRAGRHVLCLQDFAPGRPTASLDLDAVLARFARTAFRQLVWLVDRPSATPVEELEVGEAPRLPHHPGGGRPHQYVCRSLPGGDRLLPAVLAGISGLAGPARGRDALLAVVAPEARAATSCAAGPGPGVPRRAT